MPLSRESRSSSRFSMSRVRPRFCTLKLGEAGSPPTTKGVFTEPSHAEPRLKVSICARPPSVPRTQGGMPLGPVWRSLRILLT